MDQDSHTCYISFLNFRNMKKALFCILLLSTTSAFPQTANSIANGNWTNPFTWDCTCVPTPGYTVVVNHNVTLNTSFAYTSGSITINNGASLLDDITGRDIWINGGSLTNNGSLDLHYLWTQAGAFSNSGTMTVRSMLSNFSFTNTGTIQNVDSLYTTATITNNGSMLNIDSITFSGTGSLDNNGTALFNQVTNNGYITNNNAFTFTDITNNGTILNFDTITALNSVWNQGMIFLTNGTYFLVNNDILNDDVISGDALISNEGRMRVIDSWYNFDTVRGIMGSFIVGDTSYNAGRMLQSFDFCDLTPPSTAPFVDFNTGIISGSITWCQNTSVGEEIDRNLSIYPNPVSDKLFISDERQGQYRIYDLSGRLLISGCSSPVDVSLLKPGLYTLVWLENGIYLPVKFTRAN